MIHEIHHQFERHPKARTLVMGAFLIGGIEVERSIVASKKTAVAGVESYLEEEGPSIIFYRGCSEDYQDEAQAGIYAKHYQGFGSLHFPWQKSGEHSQKAIDEGVEEACQRDGNRERILVTTSMGQMNMMKSLTNPNVRNALGKGSIIGIVAKSPLTSRADLQPEMAKALNIDAHTPHLPIVGDGLRLVRRFNVEKEILKSRNMSDDVKKQLRTSANMSPILVRSQYKAIADAEPWEPGSHRFVTDENPDMRLFQITADYDRVVNRKAAHEHMEDSFEAPVHEDIDYHRHWGSHADDIRYMDLLTYRLALLSRVKRPLIESVINLEDYRHSSDFATAS